MIAVTGATGAVGSRLAAALDSPRLIVRDSARAPAGSDARQVAGYHDFDGMRAALEGASTLMLIPAAEAADRVDQHRTAIDAAVDAGVERIVYLSVVGAAPDHTFTLAHDHWATEEHVRASGLASVFPRMNLYMDFIPSMVVDGVIRGPAGDGRLAAVLRSDVAAACAALLIGDGEHDGQTFDLTGPSAFSLGEAAELLGARYVDETDEEAFASREGMAPDWEVRGWVSSYQAIRDGSFSAVSGDVERLTGRPPTSLEQHLAS